MTRPDPPSCQSSSVPCTWRENMMPENSGRLRRSWRQRSITCPTGAATPASPKSKGTPAPREVIPATTPYRSRHSASSSRGTGPGTGASVIDALNRGSQGLEAGVDVLVAPLDLPDVVDHAGAFGCQRREQHRHAGPDVGRLDRAAAQGRRTCDHGPVGIAEHDPATHTDQLVHEEQ